MFNDKKYMRFYDLRCTYVDILLSQGIPIKYIQKQVGHSNFNTTMNAYSKLIKDVNENAINILEKTVNILRTFEDYKTIKNLRLARFERATYPLKGECSTC